MNTHSVINSTTPSFNTYQVAVQNDSWQVNATSEQEAIDNLLELLHSSGRYEYLFADNESLDDFTASNSDCSLVLTCSWGEVEVINIDYITDASEAIH